MEYGSFQPIIPDKDTSDVSQKHSLYHKKRLFLWLKTLHRLLRIDFLPHNLYPLKHPYLLSYKPTNIQTSIRLSKANTNTTTKNQYSKTENTKTQAKTLDTQTPQHLKWQENKTLKMKENTHETHYPQQARHR